MQYYLLLHLFCFKNPSYFTKGKVLEFFEGIDAETIMRMHKRGLLNEIPGRDSLQFQDVIQLLSDEEWKSVKKRISNS